MGIFSYAVGLDKHNKFRKRNLDFDQNGKLFLIVSSNKCSFQTRLVQLYNLPLFFDKTEHGVYCDLSWSPDIQYSS